MSTSEPRPAPTHPVIAEAGDVGGFAAAAEVATKPGRASRWPGSLLWALLLPLGAVLAGVSGQYPYGMWLGVPLFLSVVATAAIVVGGLWHRAGAATLACALLFGLPLFAGPAFYDLYTKKAGDTVDGVVAATGTQRNLKGTELHTCTVVDASGATHRLSQQQNCFGDFEEGQKVVLLKDPAGLLEPYLVDPSDRAPDTTTLGITGGLAAASVVTLLWAGVRRRP
ncbi:hypothetical protein [Streptomyces sp. NPDC053048]|uniref:hypothetical protein n=1 Tax=Streptomyces sp. NPDC053048 TaxID=3365694 RepID=UPI0037CFA264